MTDTMSTVIFVAIAVAFAIFAVMKRPGANGRNSDSGGAGDWAGSDNSHSDGGGDGGGGGD